MDRQRLVRAAVHVRRRGGADLQPVRRLHVRLRDGPRRRRRGWTRGGAARYYYPAYWGGYGCCATASANVYGHWGATTYSGTRSWYAGGGVAGTTASGNYYNSRTGTSGSYNAGTPVQRVDRQRDARLRPHDERRRRRLRQRRAREQLQHLHRPALDGQRRVRARAPAAAPTTAPARRPPGREGNAHVGGGSTYNAKTGQTNTWGTASVGNNHYADVNGNVYKNTGDGWQQHSSSGWNSASGDNSWANRESQARIERRRPVRRLQRSEPDVADEQRRRRLRRVRWRGFGGGGFGGGGFGGGDRFGGGGFGGGGGIRRPLRRRRLRRRRIPRRRSPALASALALRNARASRSRRAPFAAPRLDAPAALA